MVNWRKNWIGMKQLVFIIDNGAHTAKAGFSVSEPKIILNCITKAKSERRRPFIGNQIEECRDASGLYYMLAFQKGYLVNWDVEKSVWDYIFSKECCNAILNDAAVVISEPLFNFAAIQEATAEIFFEEYECGSLLGINATSLSCYNYRAENARAKACIVVDSGYSFSHVVPYVNGTKIKEGIRRIDVGGKLLTNHLKEIISYRQLHVMDETYVVNQVKEDSCFVSLDFAGDMQRAKNANDNRIAKDYVLPDYTTLKRGFLREPEASGEHQTLRLSNERFAIPEILFHPSDVGVGQMGIPEAIVDSLRACEPDVWPHLLSNIVLTGGNTKFPGFRDRVYRDVRSLAPSEFPVNVTLAPNPDTYAWEGGKLLSEDAAFPSLVVTRNDYEEEGPALCSQRFDR